MHNKIFKLISDVIRNSFEAYSSGIMQIIIFFYMIDHLARTENNYFTKFCTKKVAYIQFFFLYYALLYEYHY